METLFVASRVSLAIALVFLGVSCSMFGSKTPVDHSPPIGSENPDSDQQIARMPSGGNVVDGIAAVVNGKVITQSEVRGMVSQQLMLLERRGLPQAEKAKKKRELEKETLEVLIDNEVVLAEFNKKGGQMRPHYVDQEVNRLIRQFYDGSRDAFLTDLRKSGMTLNKFRERTEKQIIVQFMRSSAVKSTKPLTPEEITSFYEKHKFEYSENDKIRLSMISIPKETFGGGTAKTQYQLAQRVRRQVAQGGDFSALAKEYSTDDGDYGWVDQKTLNAQLSSVAFKLPKGQVSEVVEGRGSFFILRVEDKKYGRIPPLSEIQRQIEDRVLQTNRKKLVEQWQDRLRRRAVVKRFI